MRARESGTVEVAEKFGTRKYRRVRNPKIEVVPDAIRCWRLKENKFEGEALHVTNRTLRNPWCGTRRIKALLLLVRDRQRIMREIILLVS